MKILVIGGTVFVGRAITKAALAKGHHVTLFHRGKSGAELFPEAERILGDRETELHLLDGKQWDAVIDTCAYVPRVARLSAEKLRDSVGRYLFVSTISTYAHADVPHQTESAALVELDDPTVEAVTGETYGGLKVLCEREVERVFGDRSLLVRPGLIYGPYDSTGRFPYWVWRLSRDQEPVLVPARLTQPLQQIDADDLAELMIELLNQNAGGAYNAAGESTTFGQMLEDCRKVTGNHTEFVPASEDFLLANNVKLGRDLPLAFAASQAVDSFLQINSGKAIQAGLRYTPSLETTQKTFDWIQATPGYSTAMGLPSEQEQTLIAAMKKAT
jgi:2'-hydroxyisoflavone reductase